MVLALLFAGINRGSSNAALIRPIEPGHPGDGWGNFRITLNGFKVENESDDDILEGDGVRDEVFITADVWVLGENGRVMSGPTLVQSQVMGQRGPERFMDRIAAGNGSDFGGLRTGNTVPARASNDPWRRTEEPRTDGRIPMLLADVKLESKTDMVVVAPLVWEWDSYDRSDSQRRWSTARNNVFTPRSDVNLASGGFALAAPQRVGGGNPSDWGALITGWPAGRAPVSSLGTILFLDKAGTRPIGWFGEGSFVSGRLPRDAVVLQAVALPYEGAVEASRSDYFGLGPGVLRIRYTDRHDHGDYTLFLQIEQLR
jgi:hypothetical protein